jgi:hypothetical protein
MYQFYSKIELKKRYAKRTNCRTAIKSVLLRRIDPIVRRVPADLPENLKLSCGESGRPSIDPELMLR